MEADDIKTPRKAKKALEKWGSVVFLADFSLRLHHRRQPSCLSPDPSGLTEPLQ